MNIVEEQERDYCSQCEDEPPSEGDPVAALFGVKPDE